MLEIFLQASKYIFLKSIKYENTSNKIDFKREISLYTPFLSSKYAINLKKSQTEEYNIILILCNI